MKKYLYLIILSSLLFACKKESMTTNTPVDAFEYTGALGDIIRVIKEDTFTASQVHDILPNEIRSLVTLNYGVTVFFIEYKSLTKDGDTVKTSGIVIIPKVDSFAIPLVSYQHGTTLLKSNAPSVNKGAEYLLNLALASEDGVVACVTDYIGLGTGDGLHLYLNPTEEANSVRDIMRAARKLDKKYNLTPMNGQVFLYGYSQGGHATMAAQRQLELENPKEFKLTASAPMAGPYALSRTDQFDLMLDSVYYPNPFYLPYLCVSLFHSIPGLNISFSQFFKPPYDSLVPLVIDGYHGEGYANSVFPYIVSNMVLDSVKNVVRNDPNNLFRIAARQYDLVDDWTPTTPMRLYHCSGDDNVFFSNAVYADSAFRSRGANCELVDVGNLNHDGCAVPALIACKGWMTGFFAPIRYK